MSGQREATGEAAETA